MVWLLSLNGGYVDTTGFLTLDGLFAAHVTGNIVSLGAEGIGANVVVLTLPIFFMVVAMVRVACLKSQLSIERRLRHFMTCKMLLLSVAAGLALYSETRTGQTGDLLLLISVLLVAAMAIQNAACRIDMLHAPPTTLMTGNLTQFVMDLTDCLLLPKHARTAGLRRRLQNSSRAILAFASGCALAALLYACFGMVCYLVPPLIALACLFAEHIPSSGQTA